MMADKNLHQHPNLRLLFSLLALYSSERLGSQSYVSFLKKHSKWVVESNVLKRGTGTHSYLHGGANEFGCDINRQDLKIHIDQAVHP
jgi:hypothetical protein